MLLDVDYILLGLPGVLISCWAWRKTWTARRRTGHGAPSMDLTGEQAARRVLRAGGIEDIPIEVAAGALANHYEAGRRRLRLSGDVHDGRAPFAIATAAHEAGHALQEASRSPWTPVRRPLVPTAELGSILAWVLLLAGVLLGTFRLTIWGLAAFSLTVFVQLLNLGAERDASRRAMAALGEGKALSPGQRDATARALGAAEWAHVASVLTGFPALLVRGSRSLLGTDGGDLESRRLTALMPTARRD